MTQIVAPPPAATHPRFLWWRNILTAILLGLILLIQAISFLAGTSPTYDEPLYLELGREVFYRHTFQGLIRPMDPPIPIVVPQIPAAIAAGSADPLETEMPRLARIARTTHAILIGIPVVLVVYIWLLRRKGWWAAILGGGMMAFSPHVVAFAAIAGTDMCFALFGLLGVVGLAAYYSNPTRRRFWIFAILTGLALSAKQSSVFLFPCFFLIDWHANWRDGGRLIRTGLGALARTVGLVAIAFLVNWAAYGFTVSPILSTETKNETFIKFLGTGPQAASFRQFLQTTPVP